MEIQDRLWRKYLSALTSRGKPPVNPQSALRPVGEKQMKTAFTWDNRSLEDRRLTPRAAPM
jgi:hypothetical protein